MNRSLRYFFLIFTEHCIYVGGGGGEQSQNGSQVPGLHKSFGDSGDPSEAEKWGDVVDLISGVLH